MTNEPYRLYYVSADRPGDDSPWSVYFEEYENIYDSEPSDPGQLVSTHPTEVEAYIEANRLQTIQSRKECNECGTAG